MKKYLRIDEIARELDISTRTVYRLIQDGKLIAFPIRQGGSLRVAASSLKRYVRDMTLAYQASMGIILESVPDDDS